MITRCKAISVMITLAAFFAANVTLVDAQTTSFGIRVTPTLLPSVEVNNPSPSNIYGPHKLGINAGIYALKYFRSGRVGMKAGLEYGALPFIVGVDAPRSAFGSGAGGDSQINVSLQTSDLGFVALTLSPSSKLPLKHRFLEFSVGPNVRFYNYPQDGFSEIAFAFNRNVPYDPDDPAAGPPDVRARVVNLDRLYLSLPISVDYVVRTSMLGQVKFGIMYNISQPLRGELDVMMNGNMFRGAYNPRTGFWGVNIQYERLSKRSVGSYQKRVFPAELERHRKALFVEAYLEGDFLSANYDMRLKKNINHGFGFSAGAGMGGHYSTEVINNNKTTDRRMLALPVAINYIVGANRHGIELGIGITPQIALDNASDNSSKNNGTFIPLRIGYRLQPKKEGFTARAALIPIIKNSTVSSGAFNLLNFGVSCGYSFR